MKLFEIGDVIRYSEGCTALMRVSSVYPGYGGSFARYYGEQLFGGLVGVYHEQALPSTPEEKKQWSLRWVCGDCSEKTVAPGAKRCQKCARKRWEPEKDKRLSPGLRLSAYEQQVVQAFKDTCAANLKEGEEGASPSEVSRLLQKRQQLPLLDTVIDVADTMWELRNRGLL